MNETFNFIIGELFLDTFNLDIVDHIKVNPKFLKYLEANCEDKILLEKSNEHPSGMIEKYKGVPVVVDYKVDDCYKLEFKHDCGFQRLVDVSSARKENSK